MEFLTYRPVACWRSFCRTLTVFLLPRREAGTGPDAWLLPSGTVQLSSCNLTGSPSYSWNCARRCTKLLCVSVYRRAILEKPEIGLQVLHHAKSRKKYLRATVCGHHQQNYSIFGGCLAVAFPVSLLSLSFVPKHLCISTGQTYILEVADLLLCCHDQVFPLNSALYSLLTTTRCMHLYHLPWAFFSPFLFTLVPPPRFDSTGWQCPAFFTAVCLVLLHIHTQS